MDRKLGSPLELSERDREIDMFCFCFYLFIFRFCFYMETCSSGNQYSLKLNIWLGLKLLQLRVKI